MNRTVSIVAFVVALGACGVPNDSPIKLDKPTFPSLCPQSSNTAVTTTATTGVTVGLASGSLDVSGGTTSYLTQVGVISDLQPPTLPSPQTGNDFIVQQVSLQYSSTPPLGVSAEQYPFSMVVPAGAAGDGDEGGTGQPSFLIFDLIGPKAAAVLPSLAPVKLSVSYQVLGQLRSGENVSSNVGTYSISVYNSGIGSNCAKIALDGPCGFPGGQDATPVICCGTPDAGC